MSDKVIRYAPAGSVASAFHTGEGFCRLLVGPLGSGKTTACLLEVFRLAQQQAPGQDGISRSRWAICRNTFPELKSTTINSFLQWFPPEYFGTPSLHESPITHTLTLNKISLELLFIALDGVDAVSKLKSLELTGVFFNELSEINKQVFQMATGRVGRYPAKVDGGCSWSGIIADSNPFDDDCWQYKLFVEDRPESYQLFKQPGGLDEHAENIANLPDGYYNKITAGKPVDWVNVFVDGNWGFTQAGKPVYPEYADHLHTTHEPLKVLDASVYVGIDFGLTPAACFAQNVNGQWRVLMELVTEDMGALQFAEELHRVLESTFKGLDVYAYGDPAGTQRSQTDAKTPFQILAAAGISASPAHSSNDWMLRRETVARLLTRMTISGEPRLIISPKCKILRKGMAGHYYYKRKRIANDDRYLDVPDKNKYSHVAEALQYLLLGAGEGDGVLGNKPNWKPIRYPPDSWKQFI